MWLTSKLRLTIGFVAVLNSVVVAENTWNNVRGRYRKEARVRRAQENMVTSPDEPMFNDPMETSPDDTMPPPTTTDEPVPEETETDGPVALRNDACEAATSITVDEIVIASNEGAANVTWPDCGTFLGGNFTGTGTFYSIVGTGEALTLDFNATFESSVSVFAGQDCDELTCVTGALPSSYDYDFDGNLQSVSGSLGWGSVAGETYIIYAYSPFGETGEVGFVVSAGGEIPANNDCTQAISIEIGESVGGSTEFGQVIPQTCLESFSGINSTTAPGVWFSYAGTGEVVLIALSDSDYDAEISLYSGESCDMLSCIANNDVAFIPGYESTIIELLEEGQTYYIFVNGYSKNSGNFTVVVEPVEEPENDACSAAVALELGQSVTGSTIAASGDASLPYCGLATNGCPLPSEDSICTSEYTPVTCGELSCLYSNECLADAAGFESNDCVSAKPDGFDDGRNPPEETAIGVWYSVMGTGEVLQVSLNDTSRLNTAIYSGEACDELSCVAADEGGTFPVVFESDEGTQYFIYVFGQTTNDRASFEISVKETSRPANDICENAAEIDIDGPPVAGSTLAAFIAEDQLEVCGTTGGLGSAGGVWFSFAGNGAPLLLGVNASFGGSFFDSQLSLFSGEAGCEDLVCLDGNDDTFQFDGLGYSSALEIDSVEGQIYFVLVHGFSDSRGDFFLELTEVEPAANSNCTTAILLEPGDLVASSTYFLEKSEDDEEFSCGQSFAANFTAPGVWYTVMGTGNSMAASVNGVEFNPQLSLFSGDSCMSLSCVNGKASYEAPIIVWESEADEMYYLFVHGDFPEAVGDFELTLEEVTRPSNDECADSVEIAVGDRILAVTGYAAEATLGECSEIDNFTAYPSLWYTFSTESVTIPDNESRGFIVDVTNYTSDHQLGVFVGDGCGELTCVTSSAGYGSSSLDGSVGASVFWNRGEDAETYYIVLQSNVYNWDSTTWAGGEFEFFLGETAASSISASVSKRPPP